MSGMPPETFGDGSFNVAPEVPNAFARPSVATTLTLPDASQALTFDNKTIKNLGPGTATIEPFSGQTIEGVGSLVLSSGESAVLMPLAEGSGWSIVTLWAPP
jgi:hypothetical protein